MKVRMVFSFPDDSREAIAEFFRLRYGEKTPKLATREMLRRYIQIGMSMVDETMADGSALADEDDET